MKAAPLARIETAAQLLAEATTVDEVKDIRDKAEAMRLYAKEARLGLEAQNHAAEIKIRAERRAGELLAVFDRPGPENARQAVGRLSPYREVLRDTEVEERTAERWQQIATVPEPEFERHVATVKALGEELTSAGVLRVARGIELDTAQGQGVAHVSNNSGDNEWYTPEVYVIAACEVMGDIDLDPASSDEANHVVGAAVYFDESDDGLAQRWAGRVWMNPPYARPLIDQFCGKLAEHYVAGDVTEACVLVNNATETGWFHALGELASAVCFPRHRVKFWHPSKESAPLQGQAVIYLGPNVEQFRNAFVRFGLTFIR